MKIQTIVLTVALIAVPVVQGLPASQTGVPTELHPLPGQGSDAQPTGADDCKLADEPPARDEGACAPNPDSPDPGVRFILTGDTGTGGQAQAEVASVMEDVCADQGCDFMVITGDNIYETGVKSDHDPQFATKFEEPYANLTIPVYLTIGNHDSAGGPHVQAAGQDRHVEFDPGIGSWHENADHQVAYTYRDDRTESFVYDGENPSAKWTMPARWYSFDVDDGYARFYSIDANALMWWGDPLFAKDPLALKQGAWLEEQMSASDATWEFVFGHQPYLSNGQHGSAGEYNDQLETQERGDGTLGVYLKRFIEENVCGEADLYLAGHDHDLQWLLPDEEDCGPDTEFIVSGAGAKTRSLATPDRHPVRFQKGSTYGFFYIELQGETLTATVYDDAGDQLHQGSITKTS